jgi:hypothetical protein
MLCVEVTYTVAAPRLKVENSPLLYSHPPQNPLSARGTTAMMTPAGMTVELIPMG